MPQGPLDPLCSAARRRAGSPLRLRLPLRLLSLLPLWLGLPWGCAAPVATVEPAHVAPRGSFRVHGAMGPTVPTGAVADALDVARTLLRAAEERALTEDEQRTLLLSGFGLLSSPPGLGEQVGLAYTPWDQVELGLRYASGGWRGALRVQYLVQERHGVDLTAGLGVGRWKVSLPFTGFLDRISLQEPTLWRFDVPVSLGHRGRYHRVWGGPKLLHGRGAAGVQVVLPETDWNAGQVLEAHGRTSAFLFGGHAGLALGYEPVFVALEFSFVHVRTDMDLVWGSQTYQRRRDGWVIEPTLGLWATF